MGEVEKLNADAARLHLEIAEMSGVTHLIKQQRGIGLAVSDSF